MSADPSASPKQRKTKKALTTTALWNKRKPRKFAEKTFRLNEVPPKL